MSELRLVRPFAYAPLSVCRLLNNQRGASSFSLGEFPNTLPSESDWLVAYILSVHASVGCTFHLECSVISVVNAMRIFAATPGNLVQLSAPS